MICDVTSTVVKSTSATVVKQQSALFDELGRLMRSIGASSQQTSYGYDRTDKLVAVTDPRSNLYSYAYDALSRLFRETDQESAEVNLTRNAQDDVVAYSDPRSLATTYVRNGFGEVIQETSPDAGTSVIVRDARGLITQITDPRGIVANYANDNAARVTGISYPSATAENVTYTYDSTASGNKGIGRLTSVTDQSGSTSMVYDALGRITSETRVIGSQTYTTAYAYDATDHLTQITYPSGRIVTYARNSLGQVSGVTTKQNSGSSTVNVVTSVTWKPMSDLLGGMTHGNGLATTAGYDLDYRLNSLLLQDGGTNISSLSYTYIDGINLTAVNDNVTAANNASLSYSPANRLATANGAWGNASFTYDGVGNRLTDVNTVGAVTTTRLAAYDTVSNRITGMTENSAALRSYTYDNGGNINTDTRPGEVFAFTYNARNRPASVTRNSVAYATYGYNAFEQLVSRATSAAGGPTGTVQYIHDLDGHIIAEADAATGATAREYIWMAANDNAPTDLPLAVVDDVTTIPILFMVHTDHLGRPIRMTDGSKATVWQASYKPWGEPLSISGTRALNLRFPGQYFQIETSLAYNWHRHYDPVTGRYTQPDPLGLVDGPSIYAYAGNSPFMERDRDGQCYRQCGGAAVGAVANIAWQLYRNGGKFGCIDGWEVASWALAGAGLGQLSGTIAALRGGTVLLGSGGGITPYIGINLLTGETYIGITNNIIRRGVEHLHNNIAITPVSSLLKNLSRYEAKAVEQALINRTGLGNLLNKINSISPGSAGYSAAIQLGEGLLKAAGL